MEEQTNAAAVAASANVPVKDGGAVSWEELFPSEAPAGTQAATTPAVTPNPSPAAQFELKTKTGSVYKSMEAATKGIEEKDTLIEQFRQRYILERGIDPITNQPVQLASQPRNYMSDPSSYVNDLTAAANKSDSQAIWAAQTKLIFDALAPFAPVMSNLAKQQAVETLSNEIKDFREFIGSENYTQALNDTPDLKDAIQRAEQDYQHHQRLPGLYKVAYRVSQGLRLPEILKSQPQSAAQPVRQTTAPTTLQPPTQTTAHASLHGGKEARSALIAKFEAQGMADQPLV